MYLTPLRSFKVPIRLQSYFPRLLGSSVSRHKRPAVAAPNPTGGGDPGRISAIRSDQNWFFGQQRLQQVCFNRHVFLIVVCILFTFIVTELLS